MKKSLNVLCIVFAGLPFIRRTNAAFPVNVQKITFCRGNPSILIIILTTVLLPVPEYPERKNTCCVVVLVKYHSTHALTASNC